jgi:hypothetical protein
MVYYWIYNWGCRDRGRIDRNYGWFSSIFSNKKWESRNNNTVEWTVSNGAYSRCKLFFHTSETKVIKSVQFELNSIEEAIAYVEKQ